MFKTLRRVFLAALVSAAGVIATIKFFPDTDGVGGDASAQNSIAVLKMAVNEVHRKPTKRVIWQPLSEGEKLYAGEYVRTAPNAEATVEFEKSKTRIDLDPDSVIVIEEVDGKMQLNFLKGSLFVTSSGAPGAGEEVTLKAGDKAISLNNTELALSKDKKGSVDVQVLKGSAALASTAQIKVNAPKPNDFVYINPAESAAVLFDVKAPGEGYVLEIQAGKTRDELKPITEGVTSTVPGKLGVPMKVGRFFWRAVARSSDPAKPVLTSSVFKLNVLSRSPAILLEPADGQILTIEGEREVDFRWSNPSRLENQVVEIFKGLDFKKKHASFAAGDESSAKIKFVDSDDYVWRVYGTLKGRSERVVSQVRRVRTMVAKELQSPALESPAENESIPHKKVAEGELDLKWQAVPGAVSYKITVVNKKTQESTDLDSVTNVLNVRDLEPGAYAWRVKAIDAKNQVSKPSAIRTFSLTEIVELRWADGKDEISHRYVTKQPTVDLKWAKGPASTVGYRLRLWGEREPASDSQWSSLEATGIMKEVAADGTYFAYVEALDAQKHVLAQSPKRKIAVASLPLLPAPVWEKNLGPEIRAQANGSVRFAWQKVDDASEYVLTYRGDATGIEAELRVRGTQTSLNRLMPGRYSVRLQTVDAHGRIGAASEIKKMMVPDTSDVRAPKVRKLKVQ